MKECTDIMCSASRRLKRLVNRFEVLGIPQKLIELYKKEPFYFLQNGSDAATETKEYAPLFKINHEQRFEGEIDKNGVLSGRGIAIAERIDDF